MLKTCLCVPIVAWLRLGHSSLGVLRRATMSGSGAIFRGVHEGLKDKPSCEKHAKGLMDSTLGSLGTVGRDLSQFPTNQHQTGLGGLRTIIRITALFPNKYPSSSNDTISRDAT